MGEMKRFEVFAEKHFGIGVRWQTGFSFPFVLSVAFPFFTITVGFGKRLYMNA